MKPYNSRKTTLLLMLASCLSGGLFVNIIGVISASKDAKVSVRTSNFDNTVLVENFDPSADIPKYSSAGCFFILNAGMTHIELENLIGTITWFTSPQMFGSNVNLQENLLQFHPILSLEPARFDGSVQRVPIPSGAYAFSVNEDDGTWGEYNIQMIK